MKAAENVFEEVEEDNVDIDNYVRDVAEWFHQHEGEMFEREEAVEKLEQDFDLNEKVASCLIGELVGDKVDPVVQIKTDDTRYIGVVDFQEFEGAYGYIDHHDVLGKQKKVVCAQCVKNAATDSQVKFETEKIKNTEKKPDYTHLTNKIHSHYKKSHKQKPAKVETGATLASGTTIGGNISWHAGNDGKNSGLIADKVDGKDANDLGTTAAEKRFIALSKTHGNGQ
ncbi:hypothetical protein [Candidatus Nanohalobium constans]|uniref:Uncharacterized protein n=1 Tax=Candidatus Nanohalobium constans TaxID=2565781 RepID=A0A5Q0UGJ0_9ARCH|nr:hypothetical protein [Candidatus Nanohalobium constans]QGA80330.1 hypothetical protein LC1Nh_0429 [Candidatus Nanohalobium constans]